MPTPVEHYETAEGLLAEVAALRARILELKAEAHLSEPREALALRHAPRLEHNAAELVAEAAVHATLAAVPWARDEAVEVARGLDAEQVGGLVDAVLELDSWAANVRATLAVGVADEDQEAYLAGWNAARELVAGLVRPAAAEVLVE